MFGEKEGRLTCSAFPFVYVLWFNPLNGNFLKWEGQFTENIKKQIFTTLASY